MKKILTILFLILLVSNVKADYNYTFFNIHPVDNEETFTYENCISCYIVLDDSINNGITEIEIKLYANDKEENGISMNISNEARYTMTGRKTNYLFIPYIYIDHFISYGSSLVVNQSRAYSYVIPYDFIIYGNYELSSGNTKFKVVPQTIETPVDFGLNTSYHTGFPAISLNIVGLSKFDVKVKVINTAEKISILERKSHLSWLSGVIYGILTIKVPFTNFQLLGDNEILLDMLSFIDLFVLIMVIIFNLFFTYPYLLGVYLLTVGNFYTVFKMKSLRELVIYYSEYFSIAVKIFNYLFTKLLEFIIYILTLLKVI